MDLFGSFLSAFMPDDLARKERELEEQFDRIETAALYWRKEAGKQIIYKILLRHYLAQARPAVLAFAKGPSPHWKKLLGRIDDILETTNCRRKD